MFAKHMLGLFSSLLIATLWGCASPLTEAETVNTSTRPFMEELLSTPCREGRWSAGQWSGTQAVCFRKDGDKVVGFTDKTTGTPKNLDGPVTDLVFDEAKRKITFKSNRGYPYELKLVNGMLLGEAKADFSIMYLKLAPQQ